MNICCKYIYYKPIIWRNGWVIKHDELGRKKWYDQSFGRKRKRTDKDLGDNTRLLEGLEEEGDGAGGENNDGELKDEEGEGVLEGVVPLPYPIRRDHRRRIAHDAELRYPIFAPTTDQDRRIPRHCCLWSSSSKPAGYDLLSERLNRRRRRRDRGDVLCICFFFSFLVLWAKGLGIWRGGVEWVDKVKVKEGSQGGLLLWAIYWPSFLVN